jgi:DNA polymerase II small subunit
MGDKKEILKLCMQKGFLIDKEILEIFLLFDNTFISIVVDGLFSIKLKEKVITKKIVIENKDFLYRCFSSVSEKDNFNKLMGFLGVSLLNTDNKEIINKKIKILTPQNFDSKKIEVEDFILHFRNRYEQLRQILEQRDIENLRSLRRISRDGESQNIIVMIRDKKITKNNNIIFEVEDLTGSAKFLINNNKTTIFEKCKNVLLDEVICFNVSGSGDLFFIEDIILPDIFLKDKKLLNDEILVAFASDIHIGSKMFLEEKFLNFINWINGEYGSEQEKQMSKKIKYLFLNGDNIDGVGVFPEQENFLNIREITDQYNKLVDYLDMIRKDVNIIISPGQHDAVWVGEPQQSIPKKWVQRLYDMKNVSIISNPSLVEIEGQIKILVYHGASFHGVIDQIPEIRINYGHNNPTMVLKELLKARHLAPTHGECDYIPNGKKDLLVIDEIPDIITTADWHRSEVSEYNNILLISSSCWQSKTPFEEKVGNNPDPCKVPVLNLKNREIKIMDFSGGQNDSK